MSDAKLAKGETKRRILAAARTAIAELGVDAASLGAVADAAGISRGTLFYHYRAKEDLVLDVAEEHMAAVTDALVASVRERAADMVGAIVPTLLDVVRDDDRSRMHFSLMHEVFKGNAAVRERMRASYERWTGLVAEELTRMGLEAGRADAAGKALVALIDGLIVQRAAGSLSDAALEATSRAIAHSIAGIA
jgi:AcrR family transcriptional regulator